jgi:hypothetical protein
MYTLYECWYTSNILYVICSHVYDLSDFQAYIKATQFLASGPTDNIYSYFVFNRVGW